MASVVRHLMVASVGLVCATLLQPQPAIASDGGHSSIPVIFDTDIGNDVDDVLALAMLHALESRNECELIAVTITKDHPLAAPFTRKINTFYGRQDVPIGVCKSGVTPHKGRYLGLAEGDEREGEFAALECLRQALASAEDHSVVIIQVGFSTNLAELLLSPADEISPFNGVDLVARKVKLLSLMAGAFEPFFWKGKRRKTHLEYNVTKDIAAAQIVAERWPTKVVWSGFEVGLAASYPHQSIDTDYRYAKSHPCVEAYRMYCKPGHDRPSWDLTSVLYAVRPDRDYFQLSPNGRVHVADDGRTTFEPTPSGRHRYLLFSKAKRDELVAAFTALASQPPSQANNIGSSSGKIIESNAKGQ